MVSVGVRAFTGASARTVTATRNARKEIRVQGKGPTGTIRMQLQWTCREWIRATGRKVNTHAMQYAICNAMIIWLDCHRRRDSTCCSALGLSSYRLPYGTVTGVIRTDNILHPASEVFDGAPLPKATVGWVIFHRLTDVQTF